jgi:hypothetical protein
LERKQNVTDNKQNWDDSETDNQGQRPSENDRARSANHHASGGRPSGSPQPQGGFGQRGQGDYLQPNYRQSSQRPRNGQRGDWRGDYPPGKSSQHDDQGWQQGGRFADPGEFGGASEGHGGGGGYGQSGQDFAQVGGFAQGGGWGGAGRGQGEGGSGGYAPPDESYGQPHGYDLQGGNGSQAWGPSGGQGASGGRGQQRGGQETGNGQHQHDPHYSSWRQKQIEQLDRDYERYNQQRQSQFDQDFNEWRSKNREDNHRHQPEGSSDSLSSPNKSDEPET